MFKIVYLAGGFKGGWHEKVKQANPNKLYFDPSKHNIEIPELYTLWDLGAINNSDLLFCYMSADNPGGYALALEIGYAFAKNIPILLIDEKSPKNEEFCRAWAMVRQLAVYSFDDLNTALDLWKKL